MLSREYTRYWLLHFLPEPEDGESICAAVAVQLGPRSFEVLFDSNFSRVRCLAPGTEPGLVRFYLNAISERLNRGETPEKVLTDHGPQFAASPPRSLALPLTDKTRQRLISRFVTRASAELIKDKAQRTQGTSDRRFADHIEGFVRDLNLPMGRVLKNADSRELLGMHIRAVKRVPLAVEVDRRLVLFDGVDFNLMKPAGAIKRINQVAHNFWQYGRLDLGSLYGPAQIRRVGVVFNGVPHVTPDYAEAHEYAVHQFDKETDAVLDTWAGSGANEVQKMLMPSSFGG